DIRIHIANMSNFRRVRVGLERRQVGVGAAVQPDDGEVQAIVRPQNLRVALGAGAKSQARCAQGSGVEKFASRDHNDSLWRWRPVWSARSGRNGMAGWLPFYLAL